MGVPNLATRLHDALDAHGGLARWHTFDRVQATLVSGGLLYALKGQPADDSPRRIQVGLRRAWTALQPFGAVDQRMAFRAGRTAIEKLDGTVVAEAADPRATFAGHVLDTPWNPLQRAYFSGYALWTYLNSPFLLTLPAVGLYPVDPIEDDGEVLHGIGAEFPADLPTHSRRQSFFFSSDGLLRRHDYRVDIAGSFAACQYLDDYTVADGFPVPLTRRAFRCDEHGMPHRDRPMVAMRFSDVSFARAVDH